MIILIGIFLCGAIVILFKLLILTKNILGQIKAQSKLFDDALNKPGGLFPIFTLKEINECQKEIETAERNFGEHYAYHDEITQYIWNNSEKIISVLSIEENGIADKIEEFSRSEASYLSAHMKLDLFVQANQGDSINDERIRYVKDSTAEITLSPELTKTLALHPELYLRQINVEGGPKRDVIYTQLKEKINSDVYQFHWKIITKRQLFYQDLVTKTKEIKNRK